MMNETQVLEAGEPANILAAARILRRGGVVVIPTDTVYGLAAGMFHTDAIERVFLAKERPPDARVPVLIGTAADLAFLAGEVPRVAWELICRFWPGPLTLVLPVRRTVPEAVTRGGRTAAVRVPAGRSCLQLLQVLGEPVIGTSANISGRPPARTAREALEQLSGRVDAVLVDDDAVRAGVASTVVEVFDDLLVVRRVGAVSLDQLRQTLGPAIPVRQELTGGPSRR